MKMKSIDEIVNGLLDGSITKNEERWDDDHYVEVIADELIRAYAERNIYDFEILLSYVKIIMNCDDDKAYKTIVQSAIPIWGGGDIGDECHNGDCLHHMFIIPLLTNYNSEQSNINIMNLLIAFHGYNSLEIDQWVGEYVCLEKWVFDFLRKYELIRSLNKIVGYYDFTTDTAVLCSGTIVKDENNKCAIAPEFNLKNLAEDWVKFLFKYQLEIGKK